MEYLEDGGSQIPFAFQEVGFGVAELFQNVEALHGRVVGYLIRVDTKSIDLVQDHIHKLNGYLLGHLGKVVADKVLEDCPDETIATILSSLDQYPQDLDRIYTRDLR